MEPAAVCVPASQVSPGLKAGSQQTAANILRSFLDVECLET